MRSIQHSLLFILFLSIVPSSCSGLSPGRELPTIKNGLLDLTNWDFDRGGIVKLDGQWEFYWKQFLTSKNLKINDNIKNKKLVSVPGDWNGYQYNGRNIGSDGFATYRLKILLSDTRQQYGLKIQEMGSAYRLFVNGKMLHSNGKPGITAEETRPQFLPGMSCFYPDGKEVEIILHVSNFNDLEGGIWHSIKLGKEDQVLFERVKAISIDTFLFGALIIMGLYYIVFFILRRKESAHLIFGSLCLTFALRTILMGERLLIFAFPDFSWEFAVKLEYMTMYACLPFGAMFINSLYRNSIRKVFTQATQLLAIGAAIFTLLTPIRTSGNIVLPYQIILMLTFLYFSVLLLLLSIRGRDGAIFVTTGLFIFFLTGCNDTFYDLGLINTFYMAPAGLFIFIFTQSFVLSSRFAGSFSKIETLSEELKILNTAREELLKQYRESRNINLQKRMNPHFFYNAINTIHVLIHNNTSKANEAVIMLSDIFRFLTVGSLESTIPFDVEWEFVKNYLEFEMLRFPDILKFEIDRSGDFSGISIPPLTIQPLVENSIKHGLRKKTEGRFIKVYSEIIDNSIRIEVLDNGKGIKTDDLFFGTLGNIRDRLKFYYKESNLKINNHDDGGVKVEISYLFTGRSKDGIE